jgi:trans-aconitate methyltransferase
MTWKFDKHVANIFDDHARKHIPNYTQVIDKSLQIANKYFKHDSAICDVGCAIGNTLQAFSNAGYTNLYGVDNSQAMLDKIDVPNATLVCSESLPTYNYDMVMCNWTLHFMNNKESYLQQIYDQLNTNGILVLSDKVTENEELTKFYYNWKLRNGVTPNEVAQKREELRGVMNIHPTEWYQNQLSNLGFEHHIIDADWCFNTFLCFKRC